MPSLDVAALSQQVTQLGLVTPSQLRECRDDLPDGSNDGEALLRSLERKSYLTALQLDKIRKGDTDGYFYGGYRVLYKISSGSFGRVFRGDDPTTGRVVALKVLRRRWTENPEQIDLFEREGRVGMSLRHPNIVEILEVRCERSTGKFYIVMEFVEGGNLRDLLVIRKKFEPAEALRLMEDMAAALTYAYSHGVTHRDIKLTNILISAQKLAKLVDFGLARLYQGMGQMSSVLEEDGTQVARTVDYAGLERATNVKSGDVRSDIYFLGAVLYEMLTGRPPFAKTKDKYQKLQRYRYENVAPILPGEINGPLSITKLIDKMMSFNPELRYQTPAHLLEAIRQVRSDVEGKNKDQTEGGKGGKSGATTVYVVERDEVLQDKIRNKLKAAGYRVLITADPGRAIEQFTRQPYDVLIVDSGTTFRDGLDAFATVINRSRAKAIPCVGVLLLNEDQRDYATEVESEKGVAVMYRPLRLGQVIEKLKALLPDGAKVDVGKS